MTSDDYFFPHEELQKDKDEVFDLLLVDFQKDFKKRWKHVSNLVEDDDKAMAQMRDSVTVHPTSAVEEQALEEWINRSKAFHFGLQWLRERKAAEPHITGKEATNIDIEEENVAPLWNKFLERKNREFDFKSKVVQELRSETFFAAEKEHEST
ncbi:hypothetical protein IAD21_03707 [Abditibacteriota bacterium]|nr:hypothetical protein IAD21_03707 [Abditibacteriota bacterium]